MIYPRKLSHESVALIRVEEVAYCNSLVQLFLSKFHWLNEALEMACWEMDFSTVLVTQASCDVFIIKGIWQSNITYATKFRISFQREKARTKMHRQIKEER